MKITYLSHSGFVVEMQHTILIFDYFEGDLSQFDCNKKMIFFVSHHHDDHFNLKIFHCLNCHYVLSDDVSVLPDQNFIQVCANQSILFEGLQIHTLRSTDLGVAFVVEVENQRIYHAGDLNDWQWPPENKQDELDNEKMQKDYLCELKKVAGMHFNLAFVPLDPRLESNACKGIKQWLEMTDTDVLFPMHMWQDYSVIQQALKTELSAWKNRIQIITKCNQVFEI